MDYATQNPIGNYQNTRTEKVTAIAPTTKRVRRLDVAPQRCKRNTKRQTQVCSGIDAANGFLRCTFLPKLKETETIQNGSNIHKMEKDFYSSLSQLTEHYQIVPIQSKQYPYPYNIALAISDMEEKLKQKVSDFEEFRLVQDRRKTYFVSEERYRTGTTLFYIPVAPLYRMLHHRKYKRNAHLLLSVFTYLYHIADIPYYRQEASYLYWMYEMMNDWVEEDDYTEETEYQLREIKQAEYIGDCMEQKLYSLKNLTFWQRRIDKFKAKDSFDKECLSISKEAFGIYQSYPSETIFRKSQHHTMEESEDDRGKIITMKQYISFYADHKDWLSDRLIDAVNCEMQECVVMEEPVIQKHFDGRDITQCNLDLENRIFELLHRLCDLLNNF